VNVFVVSTPFQALSAVEARVAWGLDDDECHLIVVAPEERASAVRALAPHLGTWSKQLWLARKFDVAARRRDRTGARHLAGVARRMWSERSTATALTALLRAARPRRLFIGHWADAFHQHCLAVCSTSEAVLLDDGMATVEVARLRAEGRPPRRQHRAWREFRSLAFGLRRPDDVALTIFTCLPIQRAGPRDRLRHHQFSTITAPSTSGNDAVFVGQPCVDFGWMTADSYWSCVRRFFAAHARARPLYLPHPREVALTPGDIACERSLVPVEVRVANGELRPCAVGGLTSTALVSLRLLLPHADVVALRTELDGPAATVGVKGRFAAAWDIAAAAGVTIDSV
jgi:hypothetical protein